MGEGTGVLLILVVRVILRRVGCAVADDGTRVQPVIRADCHRHQAEGCEGTHDGKKDLNALLTHHAFGGGERKREKEKCHLAIHPLPADTRAHHFSARTYSSVKAS